MPTIKNMAAQKESSTDQVSFKAEVEASPTKKAPGKKSNGVTSGETRRREKTPTSGRNVVWTAQSHEQLIGLLMKHSKSPLQMDFAAIAQELGRSVSAVRQHVNGLRAKYAKEGGDGGPVKDLSKILEEDQDHEEHVGKGQKRPSKKAKLEGSD